MEDLLLNSDALPFVCIVNPPCHGKSLFLDGFFFERDDFRVVEMTYNSNSKVTLAELESPHSSFGSISSVQYVTRPSPL